EEKEEIIDEGYLEAKNWLSSTKAKLLGIWCVLLVTPRRKEVKIYMDSAAALAKLDIGNYNL
ncbi:1980_t:CDS:2, partial [Racocetra fulgida]